MRNSIAFVVGTTAGLANIAPITSGATLLALLPSDEKENAIPPPGTQQPLTKAHVLNTQYLIEREVQGTAYLLHGVTHSAQYARENYVELEELVKNAAIVVPEYARTTDDEGAYFSTIINLCAKHRKPLVDINVQTAGAVLTELVVGTVAGMSARAPIRPVLKSPTQYSRRAFATRVAASSGLTYLWFSSLSSLLPKHLLFGNSMFTYESLCFSHTIDHRNVQYADRLLRVPSLFPELRNKSPVLFTSGKGHTPGIDFYLRHPTIRQLKKALYRVTWDLMGHHEITIHRPSTGPRNTFVWERETIPA